MPKIRDLGISVIPATMRPPEVGNGAGYWACQPTPPACAGTPENPRPPCQATPDDDAGCCPTDRDSHYDKDKDKSDISPDARRELQQQLRGQIGAQF